MLILTFILLLIASVYDIKYRRIPNVIVVMLLLTGIFSIIYYHNTAQKLIGLVFPSILLLIPYLMNKTGAGDVKLIASTGLILGAVINSLILFISLVFVLLFSGILFILKKGPMKSVPFAPFVCAGFTFVILITHLIK